MDRRCALSTRHYRVILKNGRHAVHEVFYNEEGESWTCGECPLCPEGDTLDALREALEHCQRALEWPMSEYADFAGL